MAERKRVLVADSEAWSVQLFVKIGAQMGVEIHASRNGIDAIEKFKSMTPSLVVVDTLLPKLDGLQVTKKIKDMELGRITPVVLTSAIYQPGPDIERLRHTYGFTDFLPKPFESADVERVLRDYLSEEAEAPAAEAEDGEPVRAPEITQLALTEMGVPALLKQLFRAHKTGILTLRQGEITKVLFFDTGHLTHASSNSRRDRLGRILLRNKKITFEQYERARRLQVESSGRQQIGSALVQIGALNENDVINAVSSQILSIVFSLFSWRSGTWSFLETENIAPPYRRFNFNAANIIFWGLRQLEGTMSFGRFLPAPKSVVDRAEDAGAVKESLHLTYFEEQILGLVDGRKRLGEIVSIGRLAQIDVERVLFALLLIGVLKVSPEAQQSLDETVVAIGQPLDKPPLEDKGDLRQTSVARLLSRVYLAGLSGSISFRRADLETTVYFDRGEIVYARSSAEEHRLASILLAGGKVTEEDYLRALKILERRQEKRIGAVFLELRALSLDELHWALRFQVQKIVLDLFRWEEGTFQFERGEAPVDLMVTLAATTPNLIMEGVRSMEPPPGILNLVMAPDTLVMKLWSDYRVTRLLQLSSAEMRLLSYIETGRSIQDLRSLGLMGDRELAATLHGLLALEVVRAMRGAAAVTPASDETPAETDSGETDTAPAGAAYEDEEVTGEINLLDVKKRTEAREKEAAPGSSLERENRELRGRLEQLEAMIRGIEGKKGPRSGS